MAGEDPDYAARVTRLHCCAPCGLTPCVGEVQIHHRITGRVARPPVKGGDRRAHDHDGMPLCRGHHGEFHQSNGAFKGMSKSQRTEFEDDGIEQTRRLLGLRTPYEVPSCV